MTTITMNLTNGSGRLETAIGKESKHSILPALHFFYQKYKVFPNSRETYNDYSFDQIMKILREEYGHDGKSDIIREKEQVVKQVRYVTNRLVDLGDGVIINISYGFLRENYEPENKNIQIDYAVERLHNVCCCKFFYLPNRKAVVEKLQKSFEAAVIKECDDSKLQMVCKKKTDFFLKPITIKKPQITDLKLHYGAEFEQIHETIIAALRLDKAHGMVLLHGLPGSGKTHYIRYLIQEITGKKLIYIPPDMTAQISSPEFLPFLLENKDSILIIEDAENIIRSRDDKGTATQAIANLLNLSDGILGDSLHQPIIATFNCEVNSVDHALLRKGRLIARYEFGKLSVESAQKLSDELGFKTKISEPMTLADIYGQEEEKKQEV